MIISNTHMIEQFSVSEPDLNRIQNDLSNKNYGSFYELIISPLGKELRKLIEKEHPELSTEVDSILTDVYKKLQRKILKSDFDKINPNINKTILTLVVVECKLALPSEENKKKNMGLTRAEYKTMIKALSEGDETIIEKVYLRHFKKCLQFLMYQYKASYEDAYASSIDALLEIRKDLLKGKIFYGNLAYYFTKRAKRKLYKRTLKVGEEILPLDDFELEDNQDLEENMINEELKSLLKAALNKLCDDCRGILKKYYYEELSLKEISIQMNKNHDAVRKKATRCRDKLRTYLGEDFYKQFAYYFDKH